MQREQAPSPLAEDKAGDEDPSVDEGEWKHAGGGRKARPDEEQQEQTVDKSGGEGDEPKKFPPEIMVDVTAVDRVASPSARVEPHLKKIRSPDHFRTQYLSNLGIWATDQAKQLTSARRTEARYRRNVGCVLSLPHLLASFVVWMRRCLESALFVALFGACLYQYSCKHLPTGCLSTHPFL